MSTFLCFLVSFALLLSVSFAAAPPEQIRLALTGEKGQMVVGWATMSSAGTTVQYTCPGCGQYSTQGTAKYFEMPWLSNYVSPQIHFATLTGLKPSTTYTYRVGDNVGGWSDEYYFTTEPEVAPTPNRPIHILSLGDEGATSISKEVLAAMLAAEQKLGFDLLVIAGDLSYANGKQDIWDTWGRLNQPLASHLPWMVAIGNHELGTERGVPFLERFSMPAKQSGSDAGNRYYSWNYGNIHFIALDAESNKTFINSPQHMWLRQDLQRIDRIKTPWVIAFFHSPWYCSNLVHQGDGKKMKDSFEDLFYQHKVDLVLQGHVHAYERSYPVYQDKLTSNAPVYITNGVGGNGEGLYKIWLPTPVWSAKRVTEYGFGYFEVFNATHLHWTMKRASDSATVDEIWLVRPAVRI